MQLVAGAAGALLLGPFGLGLTTAGFGFAAGAGLYGVFGPKPKGPGPGDLTSPGLQLGSAIGRPYGQVRMAVSPIWIPDAFRATEHSAGGKGVPSGPSSYTYDTDVLGLVADTPVIPVLAVTREWWNKKLIVSRLATATEETVTDTTDYFASVTEYLGGPSQTPAVLYETAQGAGTVPANRGMFTREYAGVQTGTSKTLPLMEVEVITKGTPTTVIDTESGLVCYGVIRTGAGVSDPDLQPVPDGVDAPDPGPGQVWDTRLIAWDADPEETIFLLGRLSLGDYNSVSEDDFDTCSITSGAGTNASPWDIQCRYIPGEVFASNGNGVVLLGYVDQTGAEAWTPLPEMLDDVITAELSLLPSYDPTDYDVTDLAAVEVRGFIAIGPPAQTIAELCDIFYVDVVPGNPIRFVRRGAASVGTIPFADTGAGVNQPSARFNGIKLGGNDEISGVKAIAYPEIDRDHNSGFKRGDRLTTDGPDVQRIDTRVVLRGDEAMGRAITASLLARLRKKTSRFAVGNKYAVIQPGDAWLTFDKEGNSYRQRVLGYTYSDNAFACNWELDDPSALVASGVADLSDEPGIEVVPAGVAEWQSMDLPQLQDADEGAGYYLASKVSDASRAYALESPDDATYTEVETFGRSAVFGPVTAVTGTLVAGPLFNEAATITVDVGSGTLTAATRAALLADRSLNGFAIVDSEGVCKVVGQYRTPTPAGAGVYTLSGLLLDRWEDARYVASVTAGDVFCRLAEGGMARIERGVAQLGIEHYVKVRAERRSPASIDGVAFTAAGVSLKPLSPVHARAERDASSGDVLLSCSRRTRHEYRFGGALGGSVPVGEETESYRWRLYTDGTFATLLRDLGTTTTSVTYTAAQRAADGHTLGNPVYVGVTQLSATVGEGYALEAAA